MESGQVVAIVFASVSAAILLVTFYLLRRTYLAKMAEAARVLGIGRQMASQLERQGQLPSALALGHPVAISPRALEIFLECKKEGIQ